MQAFTASREPQRRSLPDPLARTLMRSKCSKSPEKLRKQPFSSKAALVRPEGESPLKEFNGSRNETGFEDEKEEC